MSKGKIYTLNIFSLKIKRLPAGTYILLILPSSKQLTVPGGITFATTKASNANSHVHV